MIEKFETKPTYKPPISESETNNWAMIMHLSLFAGYIIPLAGLIAPIAIWQIKKDEMPILDEHGKVVANWILSSLIYWAVSALLLFVVIGIFMMIAMGIVSVVFPIIGAIKASSGEVWPYPMSIRFFN